MKSLVKLMLLASALCTTAAIAGPGAASKGQESRPAVEANASIASAQFASASEALPAGRNSPDVEARINRIVSAILPPVLISNGENATRSLAARMEELKVPGVSVAVIHGGQIEWARGFGQTKIGGPPVTADTLFQAGSISKPVATAALMRLVQNGTVALDTDVNQYLKNWKVPENEFTATRKVTLRGLLGHTAGVTIHGFPGYASGEAIPTLLQVLNGEQPANTGPIRVDTVPGSIWRYSGGGFTIAQQLAIDVTDKSFPTLARELVLAPAGMWASTYEQVLPQNLASLAATPYRSDLKPVQGGPHRYPEMAAAGLWTTPTDLARFAIAIQSALIGKSGNTWSATTAREMLKPGLGKYGLGFTIGGTEAAPNFSHGGVDEGFIALLAAYNEGDGAVIMTNSDNGGSLTFEVLATIANEYGWPDYQPVKRHIVSVGAQVLKSYEGFYRDNNGTIRVITLDKGGLLLRVLGGGQARLNPESERLFFALENLNSYSFVVDQARVTQLVASADGAERIFVKLDSTDPDAMWGTTVLKRIAQKVKDASSEAVLRRNIEGLRAGAPSYEKMSPQLANVTRAQLSGLQRAIQKLGAVKAMAFTGVGPDGMDSYDVTFENGSAEWRILIGPDESILSAGFRPN